MNRLVDDETRKMDAMTGASETSVTGQPAVGSDPTQGRGTAAWQRALRMGLEIQARQRRN